MYSFTVFAFFLLAAAVVTYLTSNSVPGVAKVQLVTAGPVVLPPTASPTTVSTFPEKRILVTNDDVINRIHLRVRLV